MRFTPATLVLVLALPTTVYAQTTTPAPRIVHVPLATAPYHVPIVVWVDLLHPERVAAARVHYRAGPAGPWRSAPIEQGPEGQRALIPPQPIDVRTVGYYVTVQDRDGVVRAAFASAADPHVVVLLPDEDAAQESAELAIHDHQRLEFAVGAEYANFGARPNPNGVVCGMAAGAACQDYWYTVHGTVRYHFFRTVRSVAVRVERMSGSTTRSTLGAFLESGVGLVAATATAEFALASGVSLYASGILGANDQSVQAGAGGMLEFGTDQPARVTAGLQGITNYGIAAAGWLRWETIPATPLGAGVEVTNQPGGGGEFGARLLLEVGRRFGRHVLVTARGGYGARRQDAGGFTGGLTVQLSL